MNKDLLVHYWQLPDDIFVYLKDDFHNKLCYKIQTCYEAYYQLNQCGCSKRDSDRDGAPCESLCK